MSCLSLSLIVLAIFMTILSGQARMVNIHGQNGSANRQTMMGNGFMSHRSSDGTVHTMQSDGLFMSNGNAQSMRPPKLRSPPVVSHSNNAASINGLKKSANKINHRSKSPAGFRRVVFADGSVIHVPESAQKVVQLETTKPAIYRFPQNVNDVRVNDNFDNIFNNNRRPSNTLIVSGGNGADADGNRDGADGSVLVRALGNAPAKTYFGNGQRMSTPFDNGKKPQRH